MSQTREINCDVPLRRGILHYGASIDAENGKEDFKLR